MKRLLLKSAGRLLLSPTGILFALLFTIASCKKSESSVTTPQNDIDRIASILTGEVFSSGIEDGQDEEGLVFVCKGGNDLLCLEKTSAVFITTTGALANATIIYSKYGILIRDNESQQTWLYIQNDPESREKFELVRAELKGTFLSTEIAGTIRIQSHIS
jgi:hypothetical protein